MDLELKGGRQKCDYANKKKGNFLIQNLPMEYCVDTKKTKKTIKVYESTLYLIYSTKPDSSRMFDMDEFKTFQQIIILFSRHARKRGAATEQYITIIL